MVMVLFRTKTGQEVRIRPLQSSDAPYLIDIFDHMSSVSRYHRFHQPMDNPSQERVRRVAEQVVTADSSLNFGMIAFADLPEKPDMPIGVARYASVDGVEYEAAMSVRDDMQNMGVGTQLMQLLCEAACARGITKLVGVVQTENKPALQVLENLSFPNQRWSEGETIRVEIDLRRDV